MKLATQVVASTASHIYPRMKFKSTLLAFVGGNLAANRGGVSVRRLVTVATNSFSSVVQGSSKDECIGIGGMTRCAATTRKSSLGSQAVEVQDDNGNWMDTLPFIEGRHRSVRIVVDGAIVARKDDFGEKLRNTIDSCREIGKASIWAEVPIQFGSFMEELSKEKFVLHHADESGKVANLYLWLNEETECKIPSFATHQIGVGAIVINSRDEILVVRELRNNYLPWKIPGGLADLGEDLETAVIREVSEETGIEAEFENVLSMRHTHGLQFGRSDLYFVCRLRPKEERDEEGNLIIPEPVAEVSEIAAVKWLPIEEYRAMVNEHHPMMRHILKLYDDSSSHIQKSVVKSVVPGRKPSSVYHGSLSK